MARFGGPARGVDVKSSATDMVSDADREAEQAISALLGRERPDDALLGEEGLSAEGESGRRWVVDPLDGTTNFLYGYPAWCVSVALEEDGEGLVGVVHDPERGETFSAERGGGARLNGEPLRMRSHEDLATALLATGFGYDPEVRRAQAEVVLRVLPQVRDIRRGGSAAIDLCWLAAGRLDGYWERGLKPWDWAAARLVVQEAGGTVIELPGRRHGLVATGSPELAERIAVLVRDERDPGTG